MPHPYPNFELIGGPLDGATCFLGTVATFPDGTVAARAHGAWPDWWLLYRGEKSFTDSPTRLEFVDWMPVELHPAEKKPCK